MLGGYNMSVCVSMLASTEMVVKVMAKIVVHAWWLTGYLGVWDCG
jgi:hypothetical protein